MERQDTKTVSEWVNIVEAVTGHAADLPSGSVAQNMAFELGDKIDESINYKGLTDQVTISVNDDEAAILDKVT